MNVTFLIGNGFDLNLGLKTKYADFIKQYLKTDRLDTSIIETFKMDLAQDRNNANLWANAELAMGQYSIKVAERYGSKAAEVYCDLHDDFCTKLASYLKKEQAKIKTSEIKEAFIKCFANVTKGFTAGQTNQLIPLLKKNETVNYNFIVYNYTTIIDELVENNKKVGEHTFKFAGGNTATYKDVIKDIVHAHGTTTYSMTFGVNDITQIGEPAIFDGQPDEYKSTFIKKDFNEMAEEGVFEKAQAMLESSGLIYVYGMSLGETDKAWWQRIYELLTVKQDLHVIIHTIDMPQDNLLLRKKVTFIKSLKRKFVNYSLNENEAVDPQILNRIHITGENIFAGIKNVAKELPTPNAIPNFINPTTINDVAS